MSDAIGMAKITLYDKLRGCLPSREAALVIAQELSSWLADHDAAFATAVREQCILHQCGDYNGSSFLYACACGWKGDDWPAHIRALPLSSPERDKNNEWYVKDYLEGIAAPLPEASGGRADRRDDEHPDKVLVPLPGIRNTHDEREEHLRECGRQEANSAIERALTGVEPLPGRSHIAHVLLKHDERIRLETRRAQHKEDCNWANRPLGGCPKCAELKAALKELTK